MTVWLMLAVLAVFYTLQSLFCKLFSDHYTGEKSSSSPVFSVFFGTIIGLSTLAVNGFRYRPGGITVTLGLFTALALFIYNFALIKASESGPYSFLMICNLFGGILPPTIFAALFLNEDLRALRIAAIGVMLVSFIVMNAKGLTLSGTGKKYYLWCALLFAANGTFGILINYQQQLTGGAQHSEMIVTAYTGSAVISLLYLLLTRRRRAFADFKTGKKSLLFAVLSGTVAAVAVNALLYVLSLADSSLVYTVDNGGVLVLSVLASFVLFGEKPKANQWAGIGLALVSILLFSL